ncbi:MAG: SPOR domain-containing protein [Candidatus Omnitrophica bacterium]|nr:SPOR domain-containing protein [Candidatus Omnitrophota bacterium]
MTQEVQKELFKEFKREATGLKRIAGRITQKKKSSSVYFSIESVAVIAIALIMGLVVAFALGVERGKRIAPAPREAAIPLKAQKEKVEPKKIETKDTKKPLASYPYLVQLISYKEKRKAEEELRGLSQKGHKALIIPSGEWFQVCAGGYESFKDAEIAKKEFEKTYIGCFVRKK